LLYIIKVNLLSKTKFNIENESTRPFWWFWEICLESPQSGWRQPTRTRTLGEHYVTRDPLYEDRYNSKHSSKNNRNGVGWVLQLPAQITTGEWILLYRPSRCGSVGLSVRLSVTKLVRYISSKDQNVPILERVCLRCLALRFLPWIMHSAVCAVDVVWGLSVSLSVRLSHLCIVWKRLKHILKFFHLLVDTPFWFFRMKYNGEIPRDYFNRGFYASKHCLINWSEGFPITEKWV